MCAPTELPDENSSNQSLQAGYKLPQLLNPKVHPQTHVLQDSDKTKRGCPQGNWNNGTVENFRGRCPQHQLAEDKKFEEGGVNSWGISSDTLYFERELRSCLLGRELRPILIGKYFLRSMSPSLTIGKVFLLSTRKHLVTKLS